MADVRDFGTLDYIQAEALGQPGQRRFRLQALNVERSLAILWLEKEQLGALDEALESVLKVEGYEHRPVPPDDLVPPPVIPLNADLEIGVAQLSMGLNQGERRVVLIATDSADPDEEDALNLTFEFDYRKGYELRRQIREVVSAGRPACPLCTAPMDPAGHVCVRSNGHNPH